MRAMKTTKRLLGWRLIIATFFLLLALASGCGVSGATGAAFARASGAEEKKIEVYENTGFVMGTVAKVTLYTTGADNSPELFALLSELETRYLSRKLPGSEIAAINENAAAGRSTVVSDRMERHLMSARRIAEDSGGAFDPAIGKLTALWDFDDGNNIVPDSGDIELLLKDAGYGKLVIEDGAVTVAEGAALDLGAIGKGIACDEAASFLSEDAAVTGALMNLGGSSTVTYGKKKDGEPWKIAVLDPRDETGFLGVLSLEGTNHVSTSADYEKYFIKDGKRYCHILDPSTGYPADSGLISVTVIADSGAVSDGLSTACFVLGKDGALELLKRYGAEGILVDSDRNVALTEGLNEVFTLSADGYRLVRGQGNAG
jgi:thiamine biosynthesis lipoprotein